MDKKFSFTRSTLINPYRPKKPVAPSSVKPDEFYYLIGKITIVHAGIEQDIRGVLIEDWDIPEDQAGGKYGLLLRKLFLKKIKTVKISNNDYQQYEKIMDRFRKASDKRNDIVKGVYGLTSPGGEVFKYDLKARGEYDYLMDLKQWLRKGSRTITTEELESLIHELTEIREAYFQLSRKVFLERKQKSSSPVSHER